MMGTSGILQSDISGGILRLKIDDQGTLNALTVSLLGNLCEALKMAESDCAVKVIYLTGSGRSFSVGQNLKEFLEEGAPDAKTLLTEHYMPVIRQLRSIPKPVVCGVNGMAVGAGFSLALACDVILAAESAVFRLGFSKIGLIPDAGATYFLIHSLGHHRAAGIIYGDEPLTAQQACSAGLCSKVYSDESFAEAAEEFLINIASGSSEALAESKRLINSARGQNLEQQMLDEASAQDRLSRTVEHKSAVEKFLAKSKK